MDDILASIRRIIADDDALPLSRSARAAAPQSPARPAVQAASPATPPPPVSSSADALLGLGQRLFRGGEAAAASETTSVSTFRPPAPRAAAASDPLKAPMLKLRDFAPSEPLGLRPSLGEPAKNPERAKSAEPVKAPEPAKNMASAKSVSPQTSAPPANSAKPAENVEPVNAPEIKAAEPAKTLDSLSASVANLAEARLKVSPLPLRVAAAPQPEEPRPTPAPKSSEAVSSAPAPSAPVNETAAEKPLEPPSFRPTSRRISAPPAPPPAQESEPRSLEPALLSPASGARVGASFEALAESLMLRDPQMLERVAREMLRPLLKTWLDDNLPIVVERLVRAEIERIARGRG